MSFRPDLKDRVNDLCSSLEELLEQADILIRVLPPDPQAARAAIAVLREMAERTRNDAKDLLEPDTNELTVRQNEVLSLVARGYGNKEIADVLRVTDRTVQFHLKVIFERTGTKGRAEAALFALRKGWIK